MNAATKRVREERPRGIRFSIDGSGGEVARAYLYIIADDLLD